MRELITQWYIFLSQLNQGATYLRATDTLEHLREVLGLTPPPTPGLLRNSRLRTRLLRLLAVTLDQGIAPVVPLSGDNLLAS